MHSLEQIFRNKRRDNVRHGYVAELIFSEIATVGQHPLYSRPVDFAASVRADILLVKIIDDILNRSALGIHCKNFLQDRRVGFVRLELSFRIEFIPESNLTAVVYPFENIFRHAAHDLFRKFG